MSPFPSDAPKRGGRSPGQNPVAPPLGNRDRSEFFGFVRRKGDDGFGEANFKALFESTEADQTEHGVLTEPRSAGSISPPQMRRAVTHD